jgi:serine/threonine protein kinase
VCFFFRNIFSTINNNVKLGDFGICLAFDDKNIKISKTIGTELYNSPELNKENLYIQKSDIWYS